MLSLKSIGAAIALCATAVTLVACDPPDITTLPMQPYIGGVKVTEVEFMGGNGPKAITFRNETMGNVTVADGTIIGLGHTHFAKFSSTCNRTIAAGETCVVELRLTAAGIVAATYYMGNSRRQAMGGIKLNP